MVTSNTLRLTLYLGIHSACNEGPHREPKSKSFPGANKVMLLVIDCPHTSGEEAKVPFDDVVGRDERPVTLLVSLSLSILSIYKTG